MQKEEKRENYPMNAEHTVGPASKDVPESTIAAQPAEQKPGTETNNKFN